MSEHLLERTTQARETEHPQRRQQHAIDERLVLSELDPDAVIDHLEAPSEPVDLITFGTVRETCPRCQDTHLKLVLRQRRVRIAHLFCSNCLGCYDAHYANGVSALSI